MNRDEKMRFLEMFNSMTDSSNLRINPEEEEVFVFGNKEKTESTKSSYGTPAPVEETFHFKRYSKKRVHRYSKEELEAIEKSCLNTIVNDYGKNDQYHFSDEERKQNDQLAEISMKLATVKSVYRRLDEYIEAMRIVFKAWEILSKKNYLHSKEEFFKLVAEGHIVSRRIIIPQLKNFKKYNKDVIIKYISNPHLDTSVFKPVEENPFEEESDIDEDLIYPNEAENQNLIETEEVSKKIPEKLIKKYFSPKKNKKLSLKQENFNKIMEGTKAMFNQGNNFITNSYFAHKEKDKDIYDKVKFKGSWKNEIDAWLYDMRLEEAKMDESTGKYTTRADIFITRFFDELAKNGIDSIEMRKGMKIQHDFHKKEISKKELKKSEKEILERIIKLNEDKKFIKLSQKAEDRLNQYIEKGDDDE